MTWKLYPAAQFPAFAERWQQLNIDGITSPLVEPDFVAPLLAQFGEGKELLAVYEQDGHAQAMTVVVERTPRMWETFQPSQAPVCLWVQRAGGDRMELLSSLMRSLPGMAMVLGATQQDPELAPRPLDAGALRTMDYIQTARITIAGSFDDYWNARGKNLRANLKKQRNKLAKDEVATRMQVVREPQDIAAAVADYGRLESAGWKAQGGTAIHPDNAQGRFYQAMLEGFCRRGCGSVYRYWFNDQLVAMDFCIEGADCIIVLKTTYDESVPNSLSPTLLMREEATKQIFDEAKFKRLEFYGKVMDWHTKWTDEIRTMYHATCYRWPALLGLKQLKNNTTNLIGQLRSQLRPKPELSRPPE